MVITLYAERRHPDVAEVADRLARALASRDPALAVALVAPAITAEVAAAAAGVGRGRVDWVRDDMPPEVAGFLSSLATRYQRSVIALAGPPNERILATLDASHRILLMSDPSVASLRATQRALKLCASLGYGADKVAVLLHGFAQDASFVPAEAAAVLKREIFAVIPDALSGAERLDETFLSLAERLTAQS